MTSFALQLLLQPGLIEYLVAGGVICFGALVFTLAALGCRCGRVGAARLRRAPGRRPLVATARRPRAPDGRVLRTADTRRLAR